VLSVRLYEVITLWLLAEKSTSEIKLLIGWFGLETEIATKHNQLDCCSTYYCVLYGLVWTMSHSTTCLVSLLHNIHELNWWMVIAILATFWTCGFKTFDFFFIRCQIFESRGYLFCDIDICFVWFHNIDNLFSDILVSWVVVSWHWRFTRRGILGSWSWLHVMIFLLTLWIPEAVVLPRITLVYLGGLAATELSNY